MDRREFLTGCPQDCWDTCQLTAVVEDGRVVEIKGAPGHPITRGFVCPKSRHFLERTYSQNRPLKPLLKRGSGWTPLSWGEALDLLAGKLAAALDQGGPLSIFFYTDSGSTGLLADLDQRFFNALGGVTQPRGSLCHMAGIAAQTLDFGTPTAHDPLDHRNSRCILLWGRNPAVTNIHLMPIVKEAREAGARVVVIDPIKTRSVLPGDLFLQPRPGTDAALALAMANVIFSRGLADEKYLRDHVQGGEEFAREAEKYTPRWAEGITGVPASLIEEAAVLYGGKRPSSILLGYGLQRYSNSGNTIRAIDALAAITGNIGRAGGGASYSRPVKPWLRPISGKELRRFLRTVPRAAWGEEIQKLDPPVEVMVVTRANPVTQTPGTRQVRQAMEKIPFKVVLDNVFTDTARACDLFLPVTTFLEREDIYLTSWHPWLTYAPAVISPLGGARTEESIWAELAARLGCAGHFPYSTAADWLEYALEPLRSHGITLDRLREQGSMRLPAEEVPFADGVFPTPSGKYELLSPQAAEQGITALPSWIPPGEAGEDSGIRNRYPLVLITPQPVLRTHSQFDHFSGRENPPSARINPLDLERFGINPGERAVLRSPRGSLTVTAVADTDIRPGVAAVEHGQWESRGGGVNRLTPTGLTDIGYQAALYDCRCAIEREKT